MQNKNSFCCQVWWHTPLVQHRQASLVCRVRSCPKQQQRYTWTHFGKADVKLVVFTLDFIGYITIASCQCAMNLENLVVNQLEIFPFRALSIPVLNLLGLCAPPFLFLILFVASRLPWHWSFVFVGMSGARGINAGMCLCSDCLTCHLLMWGRAPPFCPLPLFFCVKYSFQIFFLQVQENSPGHRAGLEPFFDFIVSINGSRLVSSAFYGFVYKTLWYSSKWNCSKLG